MWSEITHSFPGKLQRLHRWSLGKDKKFHHVIYNGCNYLTMVIPNLSRWAAVVHYNDVIMGAVAYLITSLTIVYSTVYSDADQRKHQSSASLAFVWGIHRGPVNSPHKWPVTRKMFPFDDVIDGSGSLFSLVINCMATSWRGNICSISSFFWLHMWKRSQRYIKRFVFLCVSFRKLLNKQLSCWWF